MARNGEEELDRWAAAASNLWLFLDYDGTLADFSRTPDLVEVDQEVVELVRSLADNSHIRLAVVSGRTLQIVRQLLPVEGIFLAGVYGVEMQLPTGEVIHRENLERIRPYLETIKPRWEALIAGQSGFFLEDKGWTLAIHAERAERDNAHKVLAEARRTAESGIPRNVFRWFEDEVFLEIAPLQAHKGKTVGYLYSHFPLPESRLIYIGDDDKDEEAFGTVHAFGGVNMLVSQRSHSIHFNEVDYIINSPGAVRAWLDHLLQDVAEAGAS